MLSGLFSQKRSAMLRTGTLYIIPTLAIILCLPFLAIGQSGNEKLRDQLINRAKTSQFNSIARLKEFYALRDYRPVWSTRNVQVLLDYLDQSESLGLNEEDYQCAEMDSLKRRGWHPVNSEDSLQFELRLTDIALHFLQDIAAGNSVPYFAYDGLKKLPDVASLLRIINDAFDYDAFALLFTKIEPTWVDYKNVKLLMHQFQKEISHPAFEDVVVSSNRADSTNKALLYRLKQLLITDSVSTKLSSKELSEKIKLTQRFFNVFPDGKLNRLTLLEINVPLSNRVQQLKATLNTLRWLTATSSYDKAVIVNIPSASLFVYENGKPLMESKIIVGKRSNPTPTLSSTITEVILYPYWMVPKRIATREFLPIVKKDVGYLDANGLQVLDQQGRIVNPYQIKWNTLSESYFPYVLRQSTGCDNSLGIVKMNFYNPFTVYLHDTPWKNLFTFTRRYFSHGCMRVEKAIDLARLLLKNNEIAIDTVTQKGCLKNQSPITVPATDPFPVLVLYQTAWMNSSGKVSFHEDIYQRLRYPSPPNRLTKSALASVNYIP